MIQRADTHVPTSYYKESQMPQEHPQAISLLLTPEFKTQPQERLTARQCLSTTKLKAE